MSTKSNKTAETIHLINKVAIITGAASGIGRSTAIRFANMGAKLTLVDKNKEGLDETIRLIKDEIKRLVIERAHSAENIEIVKVVGDLRDINVLKKVVSENMVVHEKLDILVNNAAVWICGANLQKTKIEDFDRIMDNNIRHVVLLTQLCVSHLIKTKGSIVNISSIEGTHAVPDSLPYCMSKAALDQFTKCTALELAEYGVRVNSVNPAHVRTNIRRSAGFAKETFDDYYRKIGKQYPFGRVCTPEEIADMISFIASDFASFTSGQLVHVDGAICQKIGFDEEVATQ